MTSTLDATRRALTPLQQRQEETWASGHFVAVASRIVLVAEQLCDSADLRAGWRVLDVATGSGDAAIAAARLGCRAVGVEAMPALLERGRRRARAEGLAVEFLVGEAESLPFPERSFDAVTSVFGYMFAPDHARAAAEVLRVCRPGGTIALASWTPEGFVGELFRTLAAHLPLPEGGLSPISWGGEDSLRRLLGEGVCSLEFVERTFTFRFPSAEHFVAFLRLWYGPTTVAFAALAGEARAALEADLVALARRFDRLAGEATAIPATYIEAVALRR